MASKTQPLRNEHKDLYRYVEIIRQAADAVNESLTTMAHDRIEESYNFLTIRLSSHAQAEEQVLYPMVQKILSSEQSTATMVRDHLEVSRLTAELGTLRTHRSQLSITSIQAMALRRILYGLYALLKLHFAKEEEIYLPLLDEKLSDEEARTLFEKMDAIYREARERLEAR